MERTWTRALMAVALVLISGALIWGGHEVLEEGRSVLAQEARFPVEYFLGSHLLWALSGAAVAAIFTIGAGPDTTRPVWPLLVATLVPILMILPIYVWGSPAAPSWLRQVALRPWLLSADVQAGAAVLLGALLGAALWRRLWSPTSPTRSDMTPTPD